MRNIKNVVGMDGSKLPKGIIELGKEKKLTLFVDGDRGGKLIAKNVYDNTNVEYITIAPDGKEVEELTGKEIHQALRKKEKPEIFLGIPKKEASEDAPSAEGKKFSKKLTSSDKENLRGSLENLSGRNVLILNEDLETLKEVPSSKLGFLRLEGVFVVVTKNATGTVISNAEKLGASYVVAQTFGKIGETSIELVSL